MTKKRNIIAIPIGDPAGIGPEIVCKALTNIDIYKYCKPLIIGDSKIIKKALNVIGVDLKVNVIDSSPMEGIYQYGCIDIIDLNNIDLKIFKYGEVQKQCGEAAFQYVLTAIDLAKKGLVKAITTAPINKESLKKADIPHLGHTEILAHYTNVSDPLTMFQVKNLRIFFLTRHLSLKDAIEQMSKERVYDYLTRCDLALQRLGIESRRIAVAGLNPHSGENGLFGREELDEIRPGIEQAINSGIDAEGPIPADSVFFRALNGDFDAVLSLYHDQGHIAAKMTDFHRTISITNGLPFLRTSVDHGTAFDIAGKNIASSVSMEEGILITSKYAPKFTASTL